MQVKDIHRDARTVRHPLGGWLGEVVSQGVLEATRSQNLILPLLPREGSGNLQRDGHRGITSNSQAVTAGCKRELDLLSLLEQDLPVQPGAHPALPWAQRKDNGDKAMHLSSPAKKKNSRGDQSCKAGKVTKGWYKNLVHERNDRIPPYSHWSQQQHCRYHHGQSSIPNNMPAIHNPWGKKILKTKQNPPQH
ncbi:hypothetical protein Nmel_013164 [Mimus melanotis]